MEFQSGKWLVICDRCGFKRMSDQVTSTWDNYLVCKPEVKAGCWEPRHPQDFVRSVPDDTSVPYVRKDQEITRDVSFIDSSVGVQETTIPSGHFTTNNSEI